MAVRLRRVAQARTSLFAGSSCHEHVAGVNGVDEVRRECRALLAPIYSSVLHLSIQDDSLQCGLNMQLGLRADQRVRQVPIGDTWQELRLMMHSLIR